MSACAYQRLTGEDEIRSWWHGGSRVSAVASQQEGPGFNSHLGQGLSLWSLHIPPVFACVSSSFPNHQNMYIYLYLSPVITHDRGTGSDSEVGPRALSCGCPLLLRDDLNAEIKFHCTLYVTNNVLLPLIQNLSMT